MDTLSLLLQASVGIILWVIFFLLPFGFALYFGYFLLSLRLRRQERARLFLDLIETGLKQGKSMESSIVSIAESRDLSMGVYFHLLALHLKEGLSLTDALAKVPRFLPPQIMAILQAGLRIGDIGKVLPACRQLRKDAVSQVRGAINYLFLIAFVGLPANVAVFTAVQFSILPMFSQVTESMGVPYPGGIVFLNRYRFWILGAQIFVLVAVWAMVLIYIGGPRSLYWFHKRFPSLTDSFIYALPWRRKRLQRDFATMLAILVDAGIAEPEAVILAADCTANTIFQRRAQKTLSALQQGVALPEAVQEVDDSGEFRWRLTNALYSHGPFLKAIAGWNESLDAKAFQQEQATAQAVTTGLVLMNGLLVGFVVVSVFSVLVDIINAGALW